MSEEDTIMLYRNAGVFPPVDSVTKEYVQITEAAARQIDILCMGAWCQYVEELLDIYSPKAIPVSASMLPLNLEVGMSWTETLENKKVLVIHPFASLMEKQYTVREKIFENPSILPEFQLKTYVAINSVGGTSQYCDWMNALHKMQEDVAEIDFDIALIGCGAYGMPLGAFIKNQLHKKAIHIGGTLQLLFGIKGKRWDDRGADKYLYNEAWVRPTDDLRPLKYKEIEGGCYW